MKWKGRMGSHLLLFNSSLWLVTGALGSNKAAVTSPPYKDRKVQFAMVCDCKHASVSLENPRELIQVSWNRLRRNMREAVVSNSLILYFYFIALNANLEEEAILIQHLIRRVLQWFSTTGPLSREVFMECIRYCLSHWITALTRRGKAPTREDR